LSALQAHSLGGLPEVRAGDDLAKLIVAALKAAEIEAKDLDTGDLDAADLQAKDLAGKIVAIAHKVVSKAEGAVVALAGVTPTPRAQALAAEQGKDPRVVQVVLDQSQEVMRAAHGVLICRTHHGFICANAGVDASNAADFQSLITLPKNPDASARQIRTRLRELTGSSPAVLISDSFGRAWRHGQCDIAIGCAGLTPLEDWRGRKDSAGLELRATWLAVADAIAATADLARAKDSSEPVVILAGLERFVTDEDGPGATALLRPAAQDLFR
jgi:coenzyme F420-0:L-glutamate ligase/coenzyme F420-1:gamma-L-glutamate ligase